VQTGGLSLVVNPSDQRLKADVTLRLAQKFPLPGITFSSEEIIGPGEYDIKGITIHGIPAAESGGDILETIYEVKAEGISLVFLGAPKKITDITIKEKLGNIDIIFAPSGSATLVKQLEPRIIIPTYIKSVKDIDKELGFKVESVDRLTIKKKDIPLQTEIIYINA